MKRIILILLLFSNYLTAQQWQPTSIRQRFVNGIGIPTRDTLPGALSDSSQLVLRPQDSVIYFKYKRYWRALGGQPQLNGTGFVKASGTTISYDNSSYYLASNPNGYTSNLGTVTSVSGTGTVSGLTLSGTVTSSGNLTLGGALSLTSGNVTTALGFTPYNATNPAGYITSASLSGYLPLTGGTLASSGSTNTLNINHSSGSGIALNITKNGNGEGLTIVKGSGSGNAASITGGITLLSELNLTTKLADAHINSAATWNAKQNALNGTGFVKASGTTISYDNTSYQPLLTNPTTGTGTTNYVTKWTGTSTLGNSSIFDNGNVGIGTTSPKALLHNNGSIFSGGTGDGTEINGANNYMSVSVGAGISRGIRTSVTSDVGFAGMSIVGTNGTFSTSGLPSSATYDRNLFYLNGNTGNVGIGTTSPALKLHVNSGGTGVNSFSGFFTDNSANQNGLAFSHLNGTSRIYASYNGTASDQGLAFWTSLSNGAQFERVSINANGNVGIGTTTPAEKLSVAGRLLVNTNTTDGANALQVNGSAKISSLAGTGERLVGVDASGKLVVSTSAAGTVTSGSYTTTYTAISNVTNVGATGMNYTIVGNVVTVFGRINITSTDVNQVSQIDMTVPTSVLTGATSYVGGAGTEIASNGTRTQGTLGFSESPTTDLIRIVCKPMVAGILVQYRFSFSYIINTSS
jgi:hypothetical protein